MLVNIATQLSMNVKQIIWVDLSDWLRCGTCADIHRSSFSQPTLTKMYRLPTWSYWDVATSSATASIKEAMALLILQPFCHFTYITTHSPTLPSLYLHHSSFSNTSVASSTSQFILQPFFRFSYVTSSSLNSPGEPLMLLTNLEGPWKRPTVW